MAAHKILQCYPFKNRGIEVIEGYSVYDGNLGDPVGTPHKGIDYVLRRGEEFLPFEVFSMHEGMAWQGMSDSWGRFVAIYSEPMGIYQYETIYAHLDTIDDVFPLMKPKQEPGSMGRGFIIRPNQLIGLAGTTGVTNDHIQLHLELQQKNTQTKTRQKLDPYGIYDRFSTGKYPQPGQSLEQWDHAWTSDTPSFAGGLLI